jgi:polyhydroxybutyrate depolymerase
MHLTPFLIVAALAAQADRLTPGDHTRSLDIEGNRRMYAVHVPESYDDAEATAVVLVFHGFGANGATMARFCGMNEKADQERFLAVYPYGTGARVFRLFNGGGAKNEMARRLPDDVAFVVRLLEDLETVVNVDRDRTYATGFSNGAMMCYRLAAELPDRIAAIAPIAGTMASGLPAPRRPVPVMHFHGTADPAFSYNGAVDGASEAFHVKPVRETVKHWAALNHCLPEPITCRKDDDADDGTAVIRECYRTKEGQTRVVLYVIEGGGHNWPGQSPPWFLGRATKEVSANDLMWEFFQQHPLRAYSPGRCHNEFQ